MWRRRLMGSRLVCLAWHKTPNFMDIDSINKYVVLDKDACNLLFFRLYRYRFLKERFKINKTNDYLQFIKARQNFIKK